MFGDNVEEEKAKAEQSRPAKKSKPERDKKERIFDAYKCAQLIMENNYFLTVGEDRQEIYVYTDGKYTRSGRTFIENQVQYLSEGDCSNNAVLEVIGHIRRLTHVERKTLDSAASNLICFKNGVYDILTKTLKPHSPTYAFISQIPHNYNPDAKCEKFQEFLKELLSEEYYPVIQEWFGYCLFREYCHKKAIIFVGEKDSGKTTLISTLVSMVGSDNCSGVTLHSLLEDKFAAAAMFGKYINYTDDLSCNDINATGEFKMATGGGYIGTEKKFGEKFQFRNTAKLTFATNKISGVKDPDDDAYFGRWLIIFFCNTYDESNPKTDPTLQIKLASEMEGIAAWSLEGLHRLIENKKFSLLRSAEENKDLMERSCSTVATFAMDCLEYSDSGEYISKEALYTLYSEYVRFFGGPRVTIEKLGRELPVKLNYVVPGKRTIGDKKFVTSWINVRFNQKFRTYFSNFPQEMKPTDSGNTIDTVNNTLDVENNDINEKMHTLHTFLKGIYTKSKTNNSLYNIIEQIVCIPCTDTIVENIDKKEETIHSKIDISESEKMYLTMISNLISEGRNFPADIERHWADINREHGQTLPAVKDLQFKLERDGLIYIAADDRVKLL